VTQKEGVEMSITGVMREAPELDLARVDELRRAAPPDRSRLHDILSKARALCGLALDEVADLLALADPEAREAVFAAAREAKERIYGRRMVLFAPLYASNECGNNCLYCAFRADNHDLVRRTLTMEEIAEETRVIEDMGHKRVLLVSGESGRSGAGYAAEAIETIYATRTDRGEIRRANVNMAPLTAEGFRALTEVGVGTYQCFQETYHPDQYRRLHPSGPKADYEWRLGVFDRCFAGGVDDVGMGVLFGLYDHRFDVLALLAHAQYLDERYGVGPHTVSFPRIEPAQNAPAAEHIPYSVSDDDLLLVVAVLRLAVPYTGIIMSTRESPALRRQLLRLGVSQLSAASRTYPGGYGDGRAHIEAEEQFALGDTRSLDEVVRDLCEGGYVPSFCTSCYRLGRTGEHFMEMAKPGDIQRFCTPNALLTFQEYLLDFAGPETRGVGERLIDQMLNEVAPVLRIGVEARLAQVRGGERDVYL
jgi:2-iminoacetate synthase